MNNTELSFTLEQLAKLRRRETMVQTRVQRYQAAIKQHMTEKHLDEFTHDGYKVSWKEVQCTKLDAAALKAELPDVAARYSTTSSNRRFVIQANI